jgi:HK97 family phage prohead protease
VPIVRALSITPVLRNTSPPPAVPADDAAPDDSPTDLGTLEIRFSKFNVWYEVDSYWEGQFLERTLPGAFADTIAEDRVSMRILFDHGYDPQIGNKILGPITDLREDSDSPVGEAPLFDTAYNRELLPGLRAGVYGSSMRMRVTGETWDDEPATSSYNPTGIPERTINKVRVMEFGPVAFPANPDSTATMRSLTDHFYDQLEKRDRGAFEAAVRASGLPNFTGRHGTGSPSGGEPSATARVDDAPAEIDPFAQRIFASTWRRIQMRHAAIERTTP